ncbi:MAG: ABC transporter six-transmembrane domain-containing protein [Cytophagales bacterium]|nr:ABC transporter six-transmembrane domain-containing protein [Cytophagales bacterium]
MQTFKELLTDYRWELAFVLFLILLEAGLSVLFPLFIGYAVDDAVNQQYQGAILLSGLGLATLIIGAGKRFFDSRVYARIYQELGLTIGAKPKEPVSKRSAHLGFLSEAVEFFENSLPEIINGLIALVGTILLIGSMNQTVFIGCMVSMILVIIVYGASQKYTLKYHTSYNEELENRVDVLSQNSPISLNWHLRKVMKWNIRLSDLETINFSIVWLIMISFLVLSIFNSVDGSAMGHGTLFALILYLFQYIEQVMTMPMFYQEGIRLSEILRRLNKGSISVQA